MITRLRKHLTNLKVKQRQNLYRKLGYLEEECPNRLNKTSPFGCGVSKCRICHPEKYDDKIAENELILED